ncbi:hypothetical protein F5050DRAFT_1805447 [Lentinula boryana]|uniref:Uncharacterized protein n=1 Tax=Lentinula boryana TaxID=40481 RepID=A0ABQ8QJW6_9AGAR|nr:hypothetical protein F5050DRAFT_1805447 [Lentinula boryana]
MAIRPYFGVVSILIGDIEFRFDVLNLSPFFQYELNLIFDLTPRRAYPTVLTGMQKLYMDNILHLQMMLRTRMWTQSIDTSFGLWSEEEDPFKRLIKAHRQSKHLLLSSPPTSANVAERTSGFGHMYVETAGGIHSPTPCWAKLSNTGRCLPTSILVYNSGDAKLGGISTTIAAYEALVLRGYIVDVLVVFNDPSRRLKYGNSDYLGNHLSERVGYGKISSPAHPYPDFVTSEFSPPFPYR